MPLVHISPFFNEYNDNNGIPNTGGWVQVDIAGTGIPAAIYTDNTGTVPNTNPVILTARGEPIDPIWLPDGASYDLTLYSSLGVPLHHLYNITGVNDTSGFLVAAATPPQFDNTTAIATSEFVRRQGVEYGTQTYGTAARALTAADAGTYMTVGSGAATYKLILPTVASIPTGVVYTFHNTGGNVCVVEVQDVGLDTITFDGIAGTAVTVALGDVLTLVRMDARGWNASFANRPHGLQKFTANGNFTVPVGVSKIYVTAQGGGGGGGGVPAKGAGVFGSGASGGGAGEWVIDADYVVVSGTVYAVTVGPGGAGQLGLIGLPGGGTSIGALVVLAGGGAGLPGLAATAAGPVGAAAGTGYPPGGPGQSMILTSPTSTYSTGGQGGSGASGIFGGGAAANNGSGLAATAGIAAARYGSGGGGASASQDLGGVRAAQIGGAGANGIVIIKW